MKRIQSILAIVIFALCCTSPVFSQEVYKISQLKGAVNFDGSPFEEAWTGIDFLPMVMHKPNFGNDPGEKNEVMIAYDQEYLWVGARLYYKDASKIVSKSKERDAESTSSDSFGIILDTYDDNENALAFFTMPSGLRIDYSVSNDTAGSGGPGGLGGSRNIDWNTFWDVETSRDDNGWYVEMRIPFSSLRFQTVGDVVSMGMIVNRTISYNNEIDTYPEIDPKYGEYAIFKPSLAQKIEFEGIKRREPIYFTPYVLGGFSRDRELNREGTGYINGDENKFEAGGDLKYGITSNLTLDVTVNTDFAEVEVDDVQVNLTRYSLFFPEKRPFFQERSGIFSFSLGGSQDLFYSRNIGTVDGNPVRIFGGARLVGRVGEWDLGFLDMQTEEFNDTASENFGVLRMRRQVINRYSYVGGMLTSRLGTDGSYNVAYGLDGIFRVIEDDYLAVKLAQTSEKDRAGDQFSSDPTYATIDWQRRSDKGFSYDLSYSYMGDQFNPGMGFVQQNGIRKVSSILHYGWFPGESSKLINHKINFTLNQSNRLSDGNIESMFFELGWSCVTKGGWNGRVDYQYRKEGVLFDFPIGDEALVHSGNYSYMGFASMWNTPKTKSLSATFSMNAGEYYDGKKVSFSVSPIYNVSSSLQLSGSYALDRIEFHERGQKFYSHIAKLKVLYMYSTEISASAFIQYNNTDDSLMTNLRLRYNPREGNDFYLVFNENRTLGNKGMPPEPPSYNNRTIMLKYSHTFTL